MPYRPTERTESRRREVRERIVAAALELVAAGGFGTVSVAAVARSAGVATGTVYRHFPSKADLFAEVFRRGSQPEVDAVIAATERPGDAAGRVAAAVETFVRRALRRPQLAWSLLLEPADPAVEAERLDFRRAYRAAFAAPIAAGVAAGELPEQDAELTAAAVVGAVGEALFAGPRDDEDLVAALTTFARRAVTDEELSRVRA